MMKGRVSKYILQGLDLLGKGSLFHCLILFCCQISLEISCNNFKRLSNLRRIFHSYGEELIESCLGLVIGLIIVLINC